MEETTEKLTTRQVQENLNNNVYALHKKANNTKSSKVWQTFEQIIENQTADDQNDIRRVEGFVFCTVCKSVVCYNEKNGTNQLLRHQRQHEGTREAEATNNNTIPKHFSVVNKKFSQQLRTEVKEVATQFVVRDGRPFSTVTGIGLINLLVLFTHIGAVKGKLTAEEVKGLLPDPTHMSRHVSSLASTVSKNLKETLAKYVEFGIGVTTDIWTDNFRRKAYLSLTVSYITQTATGIELRNRLAGLIPLDSRKKKTHDVLIALINKKIYDLGLADFKHKITFVTDRGGNLVKALNGEFERLNCQAHFVNNIVKECYKVPQLAQILDVMKSIARYIKINGYNELIEKNKVKSFSQTRWNGAYFMIDSIYENWEQIERILTLNNSNHSLRNINKETVKEIVDFLKPFHNLTNMLESNKVSLHVVLPAMATLRQWLGIKETDSILIREMKQVAALYYNAKNKTHKYHYIASVLYPPTNAMRVLTAEEKLHALNALREEYNKLKDEITTDDNSIHEHNQAPEQLQGNPAKIMDIALNIPLTCDEIDRYLQYFYTEGEAADPLEWWYSKKNIFPILYKLAIKMFVIPASSAQSEREFSLAGLIVTSRRSSLNPQKVEQIMLVQNQLKKEGKQPFDKTEIDDEF